MTNNYKSLSELQESNKTLIEYADEKGKAIKKLGIKTNQLRNLFEAIHKIKVNYTSDRLEELNKKNDQGSNNNNDKSAEKKLIDNLQMVRAKLAYAKGKKPEMECVRAVFDPLISDAKDYEDFKTIYTLLEAIISYHKYYEKT